jgi:nitrous oxide reductase accessory protein NosL
MRAAMASLLLLAACASGEAPGASTPPQNAEEATAQDTCGMARFSHLIGTQASAIDQSTLPPRTRVITPDMMVTMDFSAERLNVIVGTDGRVGSLRCF